MFLLLTSLAFAQDAPPDPATPASEPTEAQLETAAKLYENGARLYDEAVYDKAILAFQESYALSKQPALLFNIANAQERMGQLEEAVDTLQTYRIYATEDEQSVLDRRVATLEERVRDQKEKDRAAQAELDAKTAEAAAAKAKADAAALAAQQPVGPTTKPNNLKWALVGTGGALAVAGGIGAGATFAIGSNARNDGDKDAYDGVRTINNVSLIGAGVGLVVAGVGIALPSRVDAVAVDIRKDGAHVATTWSF